MKPEWRRFAPIGLYLSLLAVITAVVLYIIQREWNLALQISLGMVVVGLAAFAVLDPDRVRRSLTGRQARYGSNALVLTLAFIGILVVVNYVVYQNSKRWDLTEDKTFTLSQETLNALESLPQSVHAQAFFTPRVSSEQAEGLLNQYKFYAKGKFTYEFIDPEQNPIAAQQAKIARDGSIVLQMGENQQQVSVVSEQELTGAVVRLMNPETRIIYFLTGHGEYDPEGSGDRSYSQMKRVLESKNYGVSTINLLATNEIPDDASVIVVAGPTKPVSSGEVEMLKAFVDNGGALIVMEEPLPVTDYGDSADPLAEYLSAEWGITLGQDLIVDLTSQQPFAPYTARYGSHVITQKIQTVTSQFPTARSVQLGDSIDGVSVVELAFTAQQSWAETDLEGMQDSSKQITYDEGVDQIGPISLAVLGESFQTNGKVVVFGDSDFVNNNNFVAYANTDLFVNSVDWGAGKEELISLTPKDVTQRIILPPQKATMNLIMFGTVILLPGSALIAGIVVWFQRRRRG